MLPCKEIEIDTPVTVTSNEYDNESYFLFIPNEDGYYKIINVSASCYVNQVYTEKGENIYNTSVITYWIQYSGYLLQTGKMLLSIDKGGNFFCLATRKYIKLA